MVINSQRFMMPYYERFIGGDTSGASWRLQTVKSILL